MRPLPCLLLALLAGLIVPLTASGQETQPEPESSPKSLAERETLTDGWFGGAQKLEQWGLIVNLTLVQVSRARTGRGRLH
jgi:hypothetical protein